MGNLHRPAKICSNRFVDAMAGTDEVFWVAPGYFRCDDPLNVSPAASRARYLFAFGWDTKDISENLSVPEAAVYNLFAMMTERPTWPEILADYCRATPRPNSEPPPPR